MQLKNTRRRRVETEFYNIKYKKNIRARERQVTILMHAIDQILRKFPFNVFYTIIRRVRIDQISRLIFDIIYCPKTSAINEKCYVGDDEIFYFIPEYIGTR